MTRKGLGFALVGLAALLVGWKPAMPNPHVWRTLPVPYVVWADSTLEMSNAEAVEQVDLAYKEWIDLPACAWTVESSGMTSGEVYGNGINEVYWVEADWMDKSMKGPETLGLTITISAPDPDTAIESDILFNGVNMSWSLSGQNPNRTLIHPVITHEVGHFLGLGHEEEPGSDGKEPLMHPMPKPLANTPTVRADDREGAETLYPLNTPLCMEDKECLSGNLCTAPSIMGSCPRAQLCEGGECINLEEGDVGDLCVVAKEEGGETICKDKLLCIASEGIRGQCTLNCTSDADCEPDGRCSDEDDSAVRRCIFPGNKAANEMCVEDFDCLSLLCDEGFCAKPCESDCDCADTQSCKSGACVNGRSTCYFKDGVERNRNLRATLCGVRPEGQVNPPTGTAPLWVLGLGVLGLVLYRRRRNTNG